MNRPPPRALATGIVLSFVINMVATIAEAWLVSKQSFEDQPAPDETYGLLYAAAAVMAVFMLVLVRVLIWWLGLVVRGSLPATVLFGLYSLFGALVLVVPAAVEAVDPDGEISLGAIWVLLGIAALLFVLGVLFLLPSSLAWTRENHATRQ